MTARLQMDRPESALLSYSGLKAMLSYVIPAAMVVGGCGLLLGLQGLALVPGDPITGAPKHCVPVFYPFNLVAGIVLIVVGVFLFWGLRSWRKVQQSPATSDEGSSVIGDGPENAGVD
jgi:hypothetical protein